MDFIKKHSLIFILLFLAIICLYYSIGHYLNLIIDIGREIYYPKAILDGQVLYKDLFCIYGPASYLINAFIYKIFGINLNSLYIGSSISSLLIVILTYLISKKLNLPSFLSFSITLFIIFTGILATSVFNYTLPYSYAALYGILFFLASVYLLISYYTDNKEYKVLISSVFCGICVSCKYEFILYIIPFLFFLIHTKNKKLILKSLILFTFTFALPFIILFVQGLDIKSLINTSNIIKNMTQTQSLKDFYLTQGVYFNKAIFKSWFYLILNALFLFFAFHFGTLLCLKEGKIKKILGSILIIFSTVFIYIFSKPDFYLFLTFFTALFFLFSLKKNSFIENFFIISSVLVSLKTFFGLSYANYGVFYSGIIFISFSILIKNLFKEDKLYALSFIILSLSLSFLGFNINFNKASNGKINSNRGYIYIEKSSAKITNELIDFLNNLKEDNPKIVILPEGLSINFLMNKKNEGEGFYNSLIYLYIETFKEETFIEHYSKNKPDYFVISNLPSSSYKKGAICFDYGFNLCEFINKNYEVVKNIKGEDNGSFVVYKLMR